MQGLSVAIRDGSGRESPQSKAYLGTSFHFFDRELASNSSPQFSILNSMHVHAERFSDTQASMLRTDNFST